jgi:hypothetical protein
VRGKSVQSIEASNANEITVGELAIEYSKFCKIKFEGAIAWATIKLVLEYLIQNYKTLPETDFGPVRLE